MIFKFFKFLNSNNINYSIINGYKDIIEQINTESDIDILFKQKDFLQIEKVIKKFCKEQNIKMVQVLYHDLWAKNIFLFNPKDGKYLNLDLYGELSRKEIVFFNEEEIFSSLKVYESIPILSTEKEFISYLIKKLDKDDLSKNNFIHLHTLYYNDKSKCDEILKKFFPTLYSTISNLFETNDFELIQKSRNKLIVNFYSLKSIDYKRRYLNTLRTIKRILNPTGFTISFLGPDGSGKSTVIDGLLKNRLPFRRKDYFHLKPIVNKKSFTNNEMITDPHKYNPYSKSKSYIKLLYFIYQYSFGWMKNISKLKIKSSLIIFDRYFDDLLVDNKRYRYGGSMAIAKLARLFIPKPDLYFILTADANIIYERKQEVPFEELERQIVEYRALADGNRYFNIDVNRTLDEIVKEIMLIMMDKMNERY
jgi:thymidylate kinase